MTALASKAKNLNAKLMIARNFEDDNVPFQNTLQMIAALDAAAKQFDLVSGLLAADSWQACWEALME